jgi:hypothetical protein
MDATMQDPVVKNTTSIVFWICNERIIVVVGMVDRTLSEVDQTMHMHGAHTSNPHQPSDLTVDTTMVLVQGVAVILAKAFREHHRHGCDVSMMGAGVMVEQEGVCCCM